MRRTAITLGAVTLLGLAAIFLFRGNPAARVSRVFVDTYPAAGDALAEGSIEVRNGHGEFALELGGDRRLRIVRPFLAAVEDAAVQRLVAGLAQVRSLVGATPDRGELGFDAPRAILTLRAPSGTLVLRFGMEVPFEPRVFAECERDPDLWTAPRDLVDLLAGPAADLRSLRVVSVRPDEIEGLRVETPSGVAWEARRVAGAWVGTRPEPARLSLERMRDLVRAVAGLKAIGFPNDDESGPAPERFAPAPLSLAVFVTGRPEPIRLLFARDAGRAFVLDAEEGGVARIDAEFLERLEAPASEWYSDRVLQIAPASVRRVRIVRPAGALILDRGSPKEEAPEGSGRPPLGEWRLVAPVAATANPEMTNVLIDGVVGLRAARWIDDPDGTETPSIPPWIEAEVTLADGSVRQYAVWEGVPGEPFCPVRVAGAFRLAIVPVECFEVYLLPYWEFRERNLARIDRDDVTAVRIQAGSRTCEILLSEIATADGAKRAWIRREPGGETGEVVDSQFAGMLVQQWSELRALEFVGEDPDAPPPEAAGREPSARVELLAAGGESERVLARFGLFLEGERPVGILEGLPLYFVLSADPVERLKRACPFPLQEAE